MTDQESKQLAEQLRQPAGEIGIEVGHRMNQGNLYMNKNTIEALQLKTGDHVVEIGMGNGHFVKDLFDRYDNIQYSGCDFSALMVEESFKNNQILVSSHKARFYHTSAHELPFENNTVDIIFTINTLYFWDNPPLILSEFKRVLKNKGKVFITIRPKSYMEHMTFTQYGFRMYNASDVKELMELNGFKIINIQEYADPPIVFEGVEVSPVSIIAEAIINESAY